MDSHNCFWNFPKFHDNVACEIIYKILFVYDWNGYIARFFSFSYQGYVIQVYHISKILLNMHFSSHILFFSVVVFMFLIMCVVHVCVYVYMCIYMYKFAWICMCMCVCVCVVWVCVWRICARSESVSGHAVLQAPETESNRCPLRGEEGTLPAGVWRMACLC